MEVGGQYGGWFGEIVKYEISYWLWCLEQIFVRDLFLEVVDVLVFGSFEKEEVILEILVVVFDIVLLVFDRFIEKKFYFWVRRI